MTNPAASLSSQESINAVRQHPVGWNSIAPRNEGQNGFLIKSQERTLVAVVIHLADCGAALNPVYGLDLELVLSVLIEPEDLQGNLVLLTYAHLQQETIYPFPRKDEARLFAPCQALRPLPEFAVHQDHDSPNHPNQTPDFCDLKVTGTWPIPIYASELHHPGYVVESTEGITCHNPGDTAFHEGSAHPTKKELQVTSGRIDGGFNTSNSRDAA